MFKGKEAVSTVIEHYVFIEVKQQLFSSPSVPFGLICWTRFVLTLLSASDVSAWGATSRAWREIARASSVWDYLRQRDLLQHRLSAEQVREVFRHVVLGQPPTPPLLDDALTAASKLPLRVFANHFVRHNIWYWPFRFFYHSLDFDRPGLFSESPTSDKGELLRFPVLKGPVTWKQAIADKRHQSNVSSATLSDVPLPGVPVESKVGAGRVAWAAERKEQPEEDASSDNGGASEDGSDQESFCVLTSRMNQSKASYIAEHLYVHRPKVRLVHEKQMSALRRYWPARIFCVLALAMFPLVMLQSITMKLLKYNWNTGRTPGLDLTMGATQLATGGYSQFSYYFAAARLLFWIPALVLMRRGKDIGPHVLPILHSWHGRPIAPMSMAIESWHWFVVIDASHVLDVDKETLAVDWLFTGFFVCALDICMEMERHFYCYVPWGRCVLYMLSPLLLALKKWAVNFSWSWCLLSFWAWTVPWTIFGAWRLREVRHGRQVFPEKPVTVARAAGAFVVSLCAAVALSLITYQLEAANDERINFLWLLMPLAPLALLASYEIFHDRFDPEYPRVMERLHLVRFPTMWERMDLTDQEAIRLSEHGDELRSLAATWARARKLDKAQREQLERGWEAAAKEAAQWDAKEDTDKDKGTDKEQQKAAAEAAAAPGDAGDSKRGVGAGAAAAQRNEEDEEWQPASAEFEAD